MGLELAFFLAIGGLAILCAVGMLLSENAVHSALFLIGNFGCVALLFLMLDAPFISMVQIAVYTGAIMVLFLFVIMLLGAEKTTDTTRRFRWLTGSATTLAIAFLLAVSVPLVAAGLTLPSIPEPAPQVRIVHAANLDNVNVTITGETLEAPIVIDNLAFSEATDFVTLPPGEYTVGLTLAETGAPVMPPTAFPIINLEAGQISTAVAFGELNLETRSFPQVALLPNSFEGPSDDTARLVTFNAFAPERELALVELGGDQRLTVVERPLRDDEGNIVYADEAQTVPVTEFALSDRVIAGDLVFGETATISEFPEGSYEVAFVDMTNLTGYIAAADPQGSVQDAIVLRLPDYGIEQATEQTVILAAEPPQQEGVDPRPTVLDAAHEYLTLDTIAAFGSPLAIGQVMFTDYLLPVNMVGFLLLVALVGVIVLSRPAGITTEQRRRSVRYARRSVSRPLVSVISEQTGSDVVVDTPRLEPPESGD